MIDRYSRPEMKKVWSQKEKYRIWFEIEAKMLLSYVFEEAMGLRYQYT